jgi:hypothetical protein
VHRTLLLVNCHSNVCFQRACHGQFFLQNIKEETWF